MNYTLYFIYLFTEPFDGNGQMVIYTPQVPIHGKYVLSTMLTEINIF
jgi:hypothetical protein